MRILLHQDAIVERARLALIGVDAQINRPRMVLRQKAPLHPRRETSPATPAQPRVLHEIRHIIRLHRQRLFKRLVSTVSLIAGQRRAIRLIDASQKYRFKLGHEDRIEIYVSDYALLILNRLQRRFFRQISKALIIHQDARRLLTRAQTFGKLERHLAIRQSYAPPSHSAACTKPTETTPRRRAACTKCSGKPTPASSPADCRPRERSCRTTSCRALPTDAAPSSSAISRIASVETSRYASCTMCSAWQRHGPLVGVLRKLSPNAISNFFSQYRHLFIHRKGTKAQRI